MKLNAQQKVAVDHKTGPALVVAGAGTGKTRVIVERIVSLIDSGIDPYSIAALTFTEKAAQEMSDRVSEARKGYFFDVQIATFNGFGEQLIRRFASDLGINPQFQVLGDVGQIVFMKQHLDELQLDYYSPITKPDGMLSELAGYFSSLKQHVITPEQYQAFVSQLPASDEAEKQDRQRHQELAQAYRAYTRLCRQQNVIDYDDQIYLVIELLMKRTNIKKQLRSEIAYLLIDEFQDTNPMQSKLLLLLTGNPANIMAVGDDDQSIYGFRGATIDNILNFTSEYPGTQQVVLTENYRSTQAILDASYRLIQANNPERLEVRNNIKKKLHAQSDGQTPVQQSFDTHDDEVQAVTQAIKKQIAEGVDAGEIAVLVRRNQTALKLHDALLTADIPHQLAGQTHDLYKEPIIQAMLDTLRVIHDPMDNKSAYHGLRGPLFKLPSAELSLLAGRARREHLPLLSLAKTESDQAEQVISLIDQWRELADELSVGQLIYRILTDTGLKNQLVSQAENDSEAAQQVMYISQLFQQIKQYERATTHHHLSAFIDNIPLLSLAGERSNDDLSAELDASSVSVLTIHKSKGLEWDHVYIVDVTEGSLPSRARSTSLQVPESLTGRQTDREEHYREERRLMYTAMTRARTQLSISYARHHGTKTERKASRFIAEIFGEAAAVQPSASAQLGLDLFSEATKPQMQTLPSDLLKNGSLYLSVSQLNDYLRCPYDFYYRHVLKVPQETVAGLQYGSIMHYMIERFSRLQMAGETVNKQHLLDEVRDSWPMEGFDSKAHRDRALQQAQVSLASFIDREQSNQRIPVSVEQPFKISLHKLIVSGRFDAVFEDDAGVEIRDYKSGTTVVTAEKAKRRAQASDQLTQYALAWEELHGELPAVLSLDFFDTGQIGTVKKTARGVNTMRDKLNAASSAIRAFDFPEGRDHTFCQHG